jgi:hypothetical protein
MQPSDICGRGPTTRRWSDVRVEQTSWTKLVDWAPKGRSSHERQPIDDGRSAARISRAAGGGGSCCVSERGRLINLLCAGWAALARWSRQARPKRRRRPGKRRSCLRLRLCVGGMPCLCWERDDGVVCALYGWNNVNTDGSCGVQLREGRENNCRSCCRELVVAVVVVVVVVVAAAAVAASSLACLPRRPREAGIPRKISLLAAQASIAQHSGSIVGCV